jgi:hypothetical protein
MAFVNVLGNLGGDPEWVEVGEREKQDALKFSVAENIGKDETLWWNCICFNVEVGEAIAKWFKKGRPINLTGTFKGAREYEARNGKSGVSHDLVVAAWAFVNVGGNDRDKEDGGSRRRGRDEEGEDRGSRRYSGSRSASRDRESRDDQEDDRRARSSRVPVGNKDYGGMPEYDDPFAGQ